MVLSKLNQMYLIVLVKMICPHFQNGFLLILIFKLNFFLNLQFSFPRIQKKKSIAVLMTVRTVADDAVFLFWDAKTNKFTHRCYAKFFKKISFPFNFGEWFELEYLDIPQNKANIVVLDYTKVEKLVPTRVRDGLCAQFSTNQDRFLNVWHTVYPCSEKNCYYEDMGWWPWLCRKCFPDLCNLVDVGTNEKIDENSTSNNEKNQDKSKVSRLEDYVKKMRESFLFSLDDMRDFENHLSKNNESDKSTSSSPIIIMNDTKGQVNKIPIKTQKRQPVNGSGSFKTNISKMIIAVLMAVKPTGDSVFLLFDKEQGKFTHRVYSDPPKNISGNPQIGKWYKLEHKQYTNTLEIGQKIVISSVIATGNPIATRVKNGILAQFNTKDKFISVWHNNIDKWHNYKASPDGPWWPKLCSMCYSSAVTNLNRITVPSPVTEITEVSNKPWTDKLNGLIYTESENDDSDASINKNPKTNNSTIIAYSPPSTQQRKNSSPKIRPSPISVSGTLFRRTSICSIDSINILTAPIVPESPTKINMSTELVKQEERKEVSDENTEVTSILNDGGFGNARMRRFFTGSSITSSNTSPSIN
ncbi:hypothetical protein Mgra_00005386 [Meloidogyne graminicola]|uniref:Uncharacterized protein n=1 Tax=Meloidogyne graminicola TaxID=189291 RepID=A0A8S9ZPC3_9BILA|nr:hypothetical protein Mgra_00005386 [Meloidogyne graminicola]